MQEITEEFLRRLNIKEEGGGFVFDVYDERIWIKTPVDAESLLAKMLAAAYTSGFRAASEGEEYCLVQDDDSHWYVIPAEKREEFNSIIEKIMSGLSCELPEWIIEIDNPGKVKFTDFSY